MLIISTQNISLRSLNISMTLRIRNLHIRKRKINIIIATCKTKNSFITDYYTVVESMPTSSYSSSLLPV